LRSREIARVSDEPEPSDVGGAVCTVRAHGACSDAIEPRHLLYGARLQIAHERLDSLQAAARCDQLGQLLGQAALVQPLIGVDGQLRAARLGEHNDVARHAVHRPNELVLAADRRRHATNDRPRIALRKAASTTRLSHTNDSLTTDCPPVTDVPASRARSGA
jgi:hypothetical protein